MDHAGAQKAGAKLLGEVETGSLAEVLASLRKLCVRDADADSKLQEHGYFGIPELDALLSTARSRTSVNVHSNAQENAADSNKRTRSPQGQTFQQDDDFWVPPSGTTHPHSPTRQPHPQQQFFEAQQQRHASPPKVSPPKSTVKGIGPPPVLEIISPPHTHHLSSPGKTSLIYLITALAILPPSISGTPIGGNHAAIILLDPLGHFHIPRLVEVMVSVIQERIVAVKSASANASDAESSKEKEKQGTAARAKGYKTQGELSSSQINEIKTTIHRALHHIHIFRPQSWPGLLATLDSLPAYLFDGTRHCSLDRRIHAIILEDVDAYYWSLRSSSSDSESSAESHSPSQFQFRAASNDAKAKDPTLKDSKSTAPTTTPVPVPVHESSNSKSKSNKTKKDDTKISGPALLSFSLHHLSTLLSTAIISTATSTTPLPPFPYPPTTTTSTLSNIRTPIPLLFPAGPAHVPITRLALRRVPVIPFRAEISLEEAVAEKGQRWEVVARGRVECWKLGGGAGGGGRGGGGRGGRGRGGGEEKRDGGGGEGGSGKSFVFRVTEEGVRVKK